MAVCQFFLRGQCRFGDTCRNEHPAGGQQGGFGSGCFYATKKLSLSGYTFFSDSSWSKQAAAGSSDSKVPLPFTAAQIKNDLTESVDKPIWPLSSYAAAKHEPLLISGLDESAEELRVKAFTASQAGSLNEYLSYESSRIAAAEQVYSNARMNSEQAYEQAAQQSKLSALSADSAPKSLLGTGNSGSAFPSTSSAFGNTSTANPSAFGATPTPSVFGAPSNPTSVFSKSTFGQPAFGQSAFGQPAFGQPAFGQTSTPSAPTASVFGQPQNTSAQVSAFSQPQQPTSVFGQPSQAAPTSAFGQPSAFGQAAQSSAPSVIKPASGAFSAFSGSATFGTAAGSGTTGGGFSAFAGQPSAFGLGSSNPQTGGSVFGQPAFGEPPAPVQSAFATTTPSAFGNTNTAATAPPSVFGQSAFSNSNPPQPVSAFGNVNQGSSTFGAPSAFGVQSTTNTAQPLSVFAPIAPSISMEMKSSVSSGPLDFSIIKGTYKPGSTPYDEQLPPNYMDLLPKSAQEAFQSTRFEWGKVPEFVPPLSVR
ncbi:hypothetical protein GALMADRAFT_87139 [Galerina marginata CBS 339.88]|uniref:C3H1-type domain-containing protein n=1 Tax=Galerina marginata (strain CBS 339.88) TaxID=685588 RepID=A0A067TWB5_GALM3|nr:hypothetical protein GALMADRAFT_87139 [Galerina marginata CBS 339.88]